MADDVDIASDREELERQIAIKSHLLKPLEGNPGECYWCGDIVLRIVEGLCPKCRDHKKGRYEK